MDWKRWNAIIEACAAQAVDELPEDAPRDRIALRAATLAAEAICEALVEEERLAETGDS